MSVPNTLYVITYTLLDDSYEWEGIREPEVWTSKNVANKAARKLMYRVAEQLAEDYGDPDDNIFHHNLDDEGFYRGTMESGSCGHIAIEMYVYEVMLNTPSTRREAKKPMEGPGNWPLSDAKENSEEDNDDDQDSDGDGDDKSDVNDEVGDLGDSDNSTRHERVKRAVKSQPTKPTARAKQPTRKTIPDGKPNCLEGVKILFTGTFVTMDRVTSIATAKKYGAEVITNLEDTDYIVTGSRIGPKKAKTINELELEAISEAEFFDILENGVSEEKRQRMANKRRSDKEEAPGNIRKKRKR